MRVVGVVKPAESADERSGSDGAENESDYMVDDTRDVLGHLALHG